MKKGNRGEESREMPDVEGDAVNLLVLSLAIDHSDEC